MVAVVARVLNWFEMVWDRRLFVFIRTFLRLLVFPLMYLQVKGFENLSTAIWPLSIILLIIELIQLIIDKKKKAKKGTIILDIFACFIWIAISIISLQM